MRIHPALLVDKLEEFQRQINNAVSFTTVVDIDIIDWQRTPAKTITVETALSADTNGLDLNFDLMMDRPANVIDKLLNDPRTKLITINLEAKDNILELIKLIKSYHLNVAIALNPEHTIEDAVNYFMFVDQIQVMTIEPGVQGNPFIKERLELTSEIRNKGFSGNIEIDGGINTETITQVLGYPIDIISVGSAISRADNPAAVFKRLQEMVQAV